MKDPATRTRRNYRRRICSQSSTGDDDDDNDDDEKDNDLGCDSSAGVEVLKLQPHSAPSGAEKNLIAAAVVDEIVADSRGQSGEEDGLFVSSPGGGASVDATVTHTAKREDGSGQNGARIAGGIGFHMLRAMGWAENTGLGQLGKGMVDPFLPTVKEGNLGLGFNAPSEYDTQQEAIRQVQKAKREERDRKLKVKLEKAQEAEEEGVFMRESFLAVSSASYGKPSESSSTSADGASEIHCPKTGPRFTERGQCPHCGQRFETKQGLKSHAQARHPKRLQITKRSIKKERRGNASGKRSGTGATVRALAPMKQDFSIYD